MEDLEALLGAFRQLLSGRCGEIGVGACFRTANTAAQLVQLGKPEHVGSMHNERIRVGHIETRFNNRGR